MPTGNWQRAAGPRRAKKSDIAKIGREALHCLLLLHSALLLEG
jgi:hypothetical protein